MYKVIVIFAALLAGCSAAFHSNTSPSSAPGLESKVALGKALFFDSGLSNPQGMSCASCHDPRHGFADPRPGPVSEGAHKGRFTSRNAPAIAYNALGPALHYDKADETWVGGFFHDGRARTLADQPTGPLLGPVEMANSRAGLLAALRSGYAGPIKAIFGAAALSSDAALIKAAEESLAAYQRSAEVNPFSSKYDAYLAGKVRLSAQEMRGLKIFEAEDKGNCAACHTSEPGKNGEPPLFTDFTYDNLGVPRNPANPYLFLAKKFNPQQQAYIDLGLGVTTGHAAQNGQFKVPTLRNIALTGPYMHNGVFKTLEEVVNFYNTRDTDKKWGPPEVSENVNHDELGDLKLNPQEVKDLVAFLKTLTDGYTPPV